MTDMPFSKNAAKFSWMAPIGAIGIQFFSVMLLHGAKSAGNKPDPMTSIVLSGFACVLIVAGLVAGCVALWGVRKHGRAGILLPAVVGVLFNALIIVSGLQAIAAVKGIAQ